MKFGRKPRAYDKRIPRMSALRAGQTLVPLPASVNYAIGMPSDLGAMLNDSLGDCVEAAAGHAIQVWTANTGSMVTPPDSAIEQFYELAGGYVPGNPSTDNGTDEQTALKDWLSNPVDGNELAAFIEVDPGDLDDVKRTIWECGLIYIGFNVPAYLPMAAGSVWDVDPAANSSIIGGHAVVLCGFDEMGNMVVVSWGQRYTMTAAFWRAFVDECYGLVNKDWMAVTGKSPAGMTLSDLEALMQTMQFTPPSGDRRQHRRKKRRREPV
jgi:hypothetical protein